MENEVGIRCAASLPRRALLLGAATALTLTGCVSPAFRESVGQFGAATKAAVTAQRAHITALRLDEQNHIRESLADQWTLLELSDGCADALRSREPATGRATCGLIQHGGSAIEEAPEFRNILALDNALSAYADSLIALAADSTEGEGAFATSLTSLATSANSLHSAIRQATGQPEADLAPQLGAIASLVGELGNLYLAHERNRVLRDVIIRGEPLIQRAIAVLIQVANAAARRERAGILLDQLQDRAARLAIRRQDRAQLRTAQERLFNAVDAFNGVGSDFLVLTEMSTAHQKLVQAAQSGASAADIRAALDAVIHLATTAHNSVTTLRTASRSTDNAN